jgi:hypothetical protein
MSDLAIILLSLVPGAIVIAAIGYFARISREEIARRDELFQDWARSKGYHYESFHSGGWIDNERVSRAIWGAVAGKRFFIFFIRGSEGDVGMSDTPPALIFNNEIHKYTADRKRLEKLIDGEGAAVPLLRARYYDLDYLWDYGVLLASSAYVSLGHDPDFELCGHVAEAMLSLTTDVAYPFHPPIEREKRTEAILQELIRKHPEKDRGDILKLVTQFQSIDQWIPRGDERGVAAQSFWGYIIILITSVIFLASFFYMLGTFQIPE